MRRIRDTRENESLKNAEEAFERFSFQKHKRWNIIRFEENLPENLQIILRRLLMRLFHPLDMMRNGYLIRKQGNWQRHRFTIMLLKQLLCCHMSVRCMTIYHGVLLQYVQSWAHML